MDLPCTRRIDPVHQSPRTRMYAYFTHGTDPPSRPCSSGFPSLSDRLRRLPSPAAFPGPLPPPFPVTRFAPRLRYYTAVRLLTERRSLLRCHPQTLPVLLRSRAVL